MLGLKLLYLIAITFASSQAFFWSRESEVTAPPPPPPVRQLPISYIRAFAYHPVAFPQPLAPITTYHVSRNAQSYTPSRNYPSSNTIGNAISQAFQQQFFQNPESSNALPVIAQPPTQQQLPQSPQVDFGTTPTTTTTTTTTTTPPPAPTTQPPFTGSQQTSQFSTRTGFHDGYQRQLPLQQAYPQSNFGGYPQYYNQPYNQFQYNEPSSSSQFSGRVFGGEPTYQQYQSDPLSYQFIPTSISPISNQNSVKFVPCMCPVAVSISPPLVEKRTDEIPILQSTTTTESEPVQSSSQIIDETK